MKLLNRVVDWYFSKSALPYWCILMIDALAVVVAGYVGTYFEIGGGELAHHFWPITLGLALSTLLVYVPFFKVFHTYSGIIRFSSYVDLFNIVKAVVCSSSIVFVLSLLLGGRYSDVIILPGLEASFFQLFLETVMMWSVRIVVRSLFQLFRSDEAIPTIIYGTQTGGVSLASSLADMKEKKYKLRGFISDAADMKDSYLVGKRVYVNHSGLAEELAKEGIRVLLVSPLKTDALRENTAMIDEFIAAGIKIMIYSAETEWDGKSSIKGNQLQEVDIEDLLPRDKIEVDMEAIGKLLKDRSILITGAAGSIGSEMVRQIAPFHPEEMILVDQAETPMHDIRLMMANKFPYIKCETVVGSIINKDFMEKIFRDHKPDYVFHAAAYKHVPMMEDNPIMAVLNNIYGTRVIADLAVKYGTQKFVMISTDKAVNPTNVMGCSKRICEIYCQSLNQAIVDGRIKGQTQFVTTRFGNVLGSNGSVIPIFKEQIRLGGPVTVTHPDIIRFFMLIPEACRLVLEAGTMGKGGEIFVFDMGKPVRIVDLAKKMISLSGANDVQIQFTGLRDGEKLYEEVLSDKENTRPTPHPKIMVAAVREYDYDDALAGEQKLMEAARTMDCVEVVRIMKQIVPEYVSRQSKWQALDKS